MVIDFKNNKRGEWQDHIDKARERFEKELQRKKELFDRTGNVEVFTPEDIEAMIFANETFKGKQVDFSQIQKYNKLADAVRWMDANLPDVVGHECPPLPRSRSGYIYMDIKSLSFFNTKAATRTLAGMIAICDGVTLSSLDEGVIHVNFLVRDMRSE